MHTCKPRLTAPRRGPLPDKIARPFAWPPILPTSDLPRFRTPAPLPAETLRKHKRNLEAILLSSLHRLAMSERSSNVPRPHLVAIGSPMHSLGEGPRSEPTRTTVVPKRAPAEISPRRSSARLPWAEREETGSPPRRHTCLPARVARSPPIHSRTAIPQAPAALRRFRVDRSLMVKYRSQPRGPDSGSSLPC